MSEYTAFWRDHDRDMLDPEYRDAYNAEVRKALDWLADQPDHEAARAALAATIIEGRDGLPQR